MYSIQSSGRACRPSLVVGTTRATTPALQVHCMTWSTVISPVASPPKVRARWQMRAMSDLLGWGIAWDQDPGAAQRSTTWCTPARRGRPHTPSPSRPTVGLHTALEAHTIQFA